ncbi:MAG: MMPL family transporter [Spirochaetes bacterium]|nr:MMPL family transporter [Spirochaetota bacterium]
MKRIIELAVKHPRKVIALLLLATLIFLPGIRKLRIDPSTEALMPKDSHEYKINTRSKKIFGDSKLFLLTLIEGEKIPVFSEQSFQIINELVRELEEFKYFNFDEENKRLNSIIELGSVQFSEDSRTESAENNEELISDEEIDALLTGNSAEIKNDYFDVFDTSAPVPDDFYTAPIRGERVYTFTGYKPVSLENLENVLDSAGKKQLKTILFRTGLHNVPGDRKFTADEYKRIVDDFETAYLLKSIEIIKGFANPVTGEDITGTKDALVPVKLVENDDNGSPILPVSADDFTAYRQKLLANPIFENSIYSSSADGEISCLAMNIQFRPIEKHEHISRYVMDIINKYNTGNLLFTTIGVPVFERYIQEYLKRDMKVFMPFVFIVVILTFFFNFRSLSGVLLPTLSIVVSIIWTMGLMGYLGIPVTMVVNALPTILVAVGSSYSIHILNQYLHDKEEIANQKKNTGLIKSMVRISLTVFLAAFTTFIGFSTLGFNQVVSLKHFGIFSATGTAFAMIISMLLIPAVLSFNKLKADRKADEKTDSNNLLKRLILRMGNFTLSNPWPVIISTIIIFAVSVYGVSKVKIESSPLYSFKDDSYLLLSDKKVSQALDGNIVLNLMIDTGKAGGVKDPVFLKKMDEFAKLAVSGEYKSKYQFLSSYTFADIIKRMNKAMNSEKDQFYKVPESRNTIEDYIMLYSGEDRDSDGRVDTMERFTDPQFRVANIFIKTGSYDGHFYSTENLLNGIDALSQHIDNDPYFKNLKYSFAGQSMNYAVLNFLIAHGQILTIFLTLIIIAVIIFILFRDLKAAFVSLIPISCSIAVVYGTMGFLGIPIDVTKAILAAVTIGIGIDDTIHMLKTIRGNLMEGCSLKDSILKSYNEAGMAITYTSIALILGFSVFMFSEFKVLFYFGWLVAFNMVITTIAALVVLPAAVWLLNIGFHFSGSKNPGRKNPYIETVEREISCEAD